MTTPQPTPVRPQDGGPGALYDAVAVEHSTIYGYGVVSAHSTPEVNYLVSDAISEHRTRREAAIALLESEGVDAPLPAAGYALPSAVRTPTDAEKLAVSMEQDTTAAWRAVVEQAGDDKVRAFAVAAMLESAVTAARWRSVLGEQPVTVPFPGGSE